MAPCFQSGQQREEYGQFYFGLEWGNPLTLVLLLVENKASNPLTVGLYWRQKGIPA